VESVQRRWAAGLHSKARDIGRRGDRVCIETRVGDHAHRPPSIVSVEELRERKGAPVRNSNGRCGQRGGEALTIQRVTGVLWERIRSAGKINNRGDDV
jgi:hypothetical protein